MSMAELAYLQARARMDAERAPHPAHVAIRNTVSRYSREHGKPNPIRSRRLPEGARDDFRAGPVTGTDPLVRPFNLSEGEVRIHGTQSMYEPRVDLLHATFPDGTQVGLQLRGDFQKGRTELLYGRYEGERFLEWSSTVPTDNFYTERIHALWPSIDLRDRQEPPFSLR